MQNLEGQVETTIETPTEEPTRQRYASPTVETLDVGMTRNKLTVAPESINPASGS